MGFLSDLGEWLGGTASAAGSVMSVIPGLNIPGAALSAGGSLLSQQAASYNAKALNEKSMQFSADEAEKQRNWQEKMWNQQNEYNSPANMLKLMREGGLNPALYNTSIASSSSAGGGSSAAPPALQNPSLEGSRLGNEIRSSNIANMVSGLQMEKLRTEITRQNLENRDLQNRINADEETHPDGIYVLENGNLSYVAEPDKNAYQFRNKEQRNRVESQGYELKKQVYSVRDAQIMSDILELNKDILSKMDKYKLEQLIQDVRSSKLNNEILEDDVLMLKKYGIKSSDANIFTTLLRSALRNPEGLSNVLDALINTIKSTGMHVGAAIDSLLGSLPKGNGSW